MSKPTESTYLFRMPKQFFLGGIGGCAVGMIFLVFGGGFSAVLWSGLFFAVATALFGSFIWELISALGDWF